MMRVTVVLLLLFTSASYANCSTLMPPATPDSQFNILSEGVVHDTVNQLMWMQCSVGQIFTGTGCSGSTSKVSWSEALLIASNLNYAGYSNWRLPNKNELNSIVETSCALPAINNIIFPQTESVPYWTGSPYDSESKYIWSVYFSDGSITSFPGSGKAAIRLVRNHTE